MQTISIIGNMGKDAEVKNFSGKDYTVFSVGVSEKKGTENVTTWWNVYKYGKNEGLLQYLKKGTKVFISGGFSYKQSEKDGKTFINLNVNCEKLELISKPAEVAQVVEAAPAPQSTSSYVIPESTPLTSDNDSSLPF